MTLIRWLTMPLIAVACIVFFLALFLYALGHEIINMRELPHD